MKFLKTFLLVLLAVIIGIAVAIYRIAGFENSPAFFTNGNWRGTTDLPLGEDPLLTAQITCFALFALPSQEAVYLFANRDNQHKKFDSKHEYLITGNIHRLKAKYWSITAYGSDLYLIPNQANRFGFSNQSLQTDSAGNFTIHVSAQKRDGNWLPSPPDASFSLVLRLYKGEKQFMEQLTTVALPEIKIAQP